MKKLILIVLLVIVSTGFAMNLKAVNSKIKYKENNHKETTLKLKLLADKGHPESQNQLGWIYDQGQGVISNPQKAVEYYLKSANQGFKKAQINIGVMYEIGRGVPQDFEEANKWYLKAEKQGNIIHKKMSLRNKQRLER